MSKSTDTTVRARRNTSCLLYLKHNDWYFFQNYGYNISSYIRSVGVNSMRTMGSLGYNQLLHDMGMPTLQYNRENQQAIVRFQSAVY